MKKKTAEIWQNLNEFNDLWITLINKNLTAKMEEENNLIYAKLEQ